MFHLTPMRRTSFATVLVALVFWAISGDFLARDIVTEIAILAILALALDLAAGFGGMVSLAHGAIMGAGAYAYAIASQNGLPPWPAALIAIMAVTVFGGLIGTVTARLHGIFFIMTTLAFGQMAWAFTFRSDFLGGDNGLGGIPRLPLPFLDASEPLIFALFSLSGLTMAFLIIAAILRTPFGRTLEAVRNNPGRAAAIGLPSARIRMQGFALSSAIAGAAGVLSAQHIQFISPDLMTWTASGEALVVVILGGIGTLTGPVIGAAVFVTLKHVAANMTDHWHLVLGILLIAVVLAGGRGIYGQAEWWQRNA